MATRMKPWVIFYDMKHFKHSTPVILKVFSSIFLNFVNVEKELKGKKDEIKKVYDEKLKDCQEIYASFDVLFSRFDKDEHCERELQFTIGNKTREAVCLVGISYHACEEDPQLSCEIREKIKEIALLECELWEYVKSIMEIAPGIKRKLACVPEFKLMQYFK